MMRNFLLLLCYLFITIRQSDAQNENNMWYFGKYAALDFNSGSPVPLSNSTMTTWEGCASIADPITGSLLFYTNGEYVWGSNNFIMPNGTGLWGQYSSSQSSLIVPMPGSDSLYYIFTTDAGTGGFPNGGVMGYSIVDMSLNGGLGDVTIKNVALFDTTSEQLTATLNDQGCKVWVLAHRWESDEFYAYLVSDSGISAPVISAAGGVHEWAYFGQMKVSPDGSRLALPLPMDSIGNSFVELFDFDNATGVVSNGISLPHDHLVYGLEFSPSSQYLYTVDHNNSASIIYKQVSQFDVTLGNAAAINASKVIVGIIWNSTTFFNGAAQLGPDGKIYIVPTDKDSLCVINDPNNAGLTCNLVVPGLYIQNQNDHGLPNRVVAVTNPCTPNALFFGNNHICPGTCTSFNNLSTGSTSYQWIFTGANPSTSTDVSPSNICYSNPGTYSVSLIAMNTSGSDTLTLNNFITVYPFPPAQGISQSGDTLFAIPGAVSYQWYFNGDTIAGATDYFYLALEGGDYNVVATDANDCEVEAAIFDVVAEIQLAIGNWQLAIYPNPVVDNLRIRCAPGNSNWLELKSISICNILGERVLAICLPTAYYPPIAIGMPIDLDCRLLPPGIYFLKVTSRNNETQTFKFSIQR